MRCRRNAIHAWLTDDVMSASTTWAIRPRAPDTDADSAPAGSHKNTAVDGLHPVFQI